MSTTLLLTSTGLSAPTAMTRLKELMNIHKLSTCGIVHNAAEGGSEGKYVQLASQQFNKLGITTTFIDISDTNTASAFDILYIAGGNTFKLGNDLRSGIGRDAMLQFVRAAKIIIGVSAGAIVLTPTIRIANEVDPDVNSVGLDNFDALGLVSYEFSPHYEAAQEDDIRRYEESYNVQVKRCDNDSFVETVIGI